MDDLSPYDRATVNLWARSAAELHAHAESGHLIEAAIHVVLAGLRGYVQPPALFHAYEDHAAADLTMIRSVVEAPLSDELLWRVRDAAFHLRWLELSGSG